MLDPVLPGGAFSHSQYDTFKACGRSYEFKYIKGRKSPPSPAMARGTAIHAAIEAALRAKVAGSAVDKSVTADALVDMAKQEPADADPRMQPTTHVSWAFFSSPTTFTVKVRAADFPKPVHVELGLTAHGWRVVRVRLPAELLEQTHWKV